MRRSLPGHWRESSDDKDDKIDTESYQATLPRNLSHNGPKPVEGIEIPATHSIHMVINWLTAVRSILRFRFKASLGPTIIRYLSVRPDRRLLMSPKRLPYSDAIKESFNVKSDWKEFDGEIKQEDPQGMPTPLGEAVKITTYQQ